jgi:AcrR family transcriptional regulator
MPPQVSFPKNVILNEAFEIVRQEGLQALTARKIAQNLKSSTQPIYRAFQSMKDLETAVIDKAKAYAVNYLLEGGGKRSGRF